MNHRFLSKSDKFLRRHTHVQHTKNFTWTNIWITIRKFVPTKNVCMCMFVLHVNIERIYACRIYCKIIRFVEQWMHFNFALAIEYDELCVKRSNTNHAAGLYILNASLIWPIYRLHTILHDVGVCVCVSVYLIKQSIQVNEILVDMYFMDIFVVHTYSTCETQIIYSIAWHDMKLKPLYSYFDIHINLWIFIS